MIGPSLPAVPVRWRYSDLLCRRFQTDTLFAKTLAPEVLGVPTCQPTLVQVYLACKFNQFFSLFFAGQKRHHVGEYTVVILTIDD
jgi:hypothetical protein